MKKLLLIFGCLICCLANAQFINNNGISIVNSANLYTNGDWINSSGTSIKHDGRIHTSQSFINNGTLDPSSRGGFTLNYLSDLNFQPGGSSMGYVSKYGAGNLLLTGTIAIKDSLILKGGLIQVLNANDTVALRSEALLVSSPTSYVEGMVARAGIGNLLFPLGRDGMYLPLTMNKTNAKKLTASVEPTPAAHTAGPGVDALIGFPYAWRVREQLNSDTAAYVEVNYPNTLPVVSNPIVARQVSGQRFASMGARVKSDLAGRVTVRSYSRGTKGLFTVAQGFPGDFVTDSLALVALYNATGGNNWTNKATNKWLQAPVDEWLGVTVTGQSITAINLSNNNLTGPVPDHLVDILSLQSVNLSSNAITEIPVFTANPEISSLNVTNNKLTFASLEPNASVLGLNYQIQATYGTPKNESVPVGTAVTFAADAGGAGSVYQWKRNGTNVPSATSSTYVVPAITRETMGEYFAEVTNPALPGLTLKSAVQKTLAYATIDGKLFVSETQPGTAGTMLLYKVNNTKFDIIDTVTVANSGTYKFEKVILDDYQIRGFADTLVHVRALPTYYKNTAYWEEADTLFLENNVAELNIFSVFEPLPSSGKGIISGTLEEEVPGSGGRIKLPRPVKGAGVSARRVQSTGRGKEEVLVLVAYVFTDDEGNFTLPNLPNGTYRINIQYPGYPMDNSSDITLVIGDGLQSQISVDAKVLDNKINVKKLVITGLFETEDYRVQLYPNPSAEYINLNFDSESKGRAVEITAMSGRKVLIEDASERAKNIYVGDFGRGIYLLHIKEGGKAVKTLKVVIE